MKKIFHFLIISLSIVSVSHAQINPIKGRVLDKNDFPLPGAIIQIEGTNNMTVSDFNGYFSLMTESESVKVKINYMGFESLEEELQFPLDISDTKIFILTPSVNELKEIKQKLAFYPNAYLLTNVRNTQVLDSLENWELVFKRKSVFEYHITKIYQKRD